MDTTRVQLTVTPFRAYRYNPAVVGSVGDCIAPPYDVIDADLQARLYARNPYNIVRIIQGRQDGEDVYVQAAAHLKSWIDSGALVPETEASIYGYVQDFDVAGRSFQRQSFISLLELQPFGAAIKPHEQILKGPIQDRLRLKRATQARFGLVFMLYDDPATVVEQAIGHAQVQDPCLDFQDDQGVRHRLYAIADPEAIDAIVTMMADQTCVIADGHHRYTTGLALSEESDQPGARYQMTAFANIRQEGLVVLATHRLVHGLDQVLAANLIETLADDFEHAQWAFTDEASKDRARQAMLQTLHQGHTQGRCVFGFYDGGAAFHSLSLTRTDRMDRVAAEMSPAWRGLDVAVLHKLILEGALGIDENKLSGGQYVRYVKDTPTAIDDSIAQVDAGNEQAAFFTNPIRLEQLFAVAEAGERMPQKSTYFYPKMYTGLTIQKL